MEALPSLVIAAQNGDLDAFAQIVRRFQGMAFTLAYANWPRTWRRKPLSRHT
ncbi:MAG TPA: hypothetical protein VKV20_19410 [Ktedonobacteraceae bacterium]|nr:hypothetical protein [Ktedonobacteraceae bacterium]